MPRRVFFSFHYKDDIWRVNVVRNSGVVVGSSAAGFLDASLWEKTKRKGAKAVNALIDRGLKGTSVTCVLIGQKTARRKYVTYEIEQSVKRGNGLLGIHINDIKDLDGEKHLWPGEVPAALKKYGAPVYEWDSRSFGRWVEKAYLRAKEGPPKDIVGRIVRAFR